MTRSDVRRPRAWRARLSLRPRLVVDALEHLMGGLGTAVLAMPVLALLVLTGLLCLVGVGVWLLPGALSLVHVVADRERARLSRWGPAVVGPQRPPAGLRSALRDAGTRREVAWLFTHVALGLPLGLAGFTLPLNAVRDGTFVLWWQLLAPEEATASLGFWTVRDYRGAALVSLMGAGWLVLAALVLPGLARLQAWPGRRLLATPAGDLGLRVAQLTATRAGALEAHAAELRRIERSLHDGTQNRLVAVTVLLGAARRAVGRDPAAAEELMDRAQGAAEQALADLREVVRSILPPVLSDRSLADALTGLAAASPVPCQVDVDVTQPCPATVEATAYFTVAETLTNVARHSGATRVRVAVRAADDRLRVEVTDDGRGGADETRGSGLAGIRRRVEAHDGAFRLASPPGGPTTVAVDLPCGH